MKYIYDIILNFNEKLYEFYEWENIDNIEYIKKIPIFKVSNKVFFDIKNNNIKISNDFLNSILNKTEIYNNYGINVVKYSCLFCIDNSVLAIVFNNLGVSIYRSDLCKDEEEDILKYTRKIKDISFKYEITSSITNSTLTRKESNIINFIIKELNTMYKNDNKDKLKYIYYECFNKKEDNLFKIKLDLEKYALKYPDDIFNLLVIDYSRGLQS